MVLEMEEVCPSQGGFSQCLVGEGLASGLFCPAAFARAALSAHSFILRVVLHMHVGVRVHAYVPTSVGTCDSQDHVKRLKQRAERSRFLGALDTPSQGHNRLGVFMPCLHFHTPLLFP